MYASSLLFLIRSYFLKQLVIFDQVLYADKVLQFFGMIEDRLEFSINNRNDKILFSRCLIDSSWLKKQKRVQNNIVTPLNPILDNYKGKGELVNWPNRQIIHILPLVLYHMLCHPY